MIKQKFDQFKIWPSVGQVVFVSFLTDNYISTILVGKCVSRRFNHSNSTITIATAFSRHQLFFYSPTVFCIIPEVFSVENSFRPAIVKGPEYYEKANNLLKQYNLLYLTND